MTRNMPLPAVDDAQDDPSTPSPALLAVPDDPEDVDELTFVPAATSPTRRATTWLTCDVDDAVDVAEMR